MDDRDDVRPSIYSQLSETLRGLHHPLSSRATSSGKKRLEMQGRDSRGRTVRGKNRGLGLGLKEISPGPRPGPWP